MSRGNVSQGAVSQGPVSRSPGVHTDRSPDVLVVGAGIVGAACAWHLTKSGFAVDVIDAGGVAGGATAEGMGHLVVMDDSPAQLDLTRWSLELWRQLLPQLPRDCDVHPCGTLWVAEDDDDLEALHGKSALLTRAGVPHQLVESNDLRHLEPCLRPGLPGALHVPGDAIVYPPRVAAYLLRQSAEHHGLECQTGQEVVRLDGGRDGRPAVAHLADGSTRSAAWIVNAAGHRALDLLPNLPQGLELAPRKGHLVISQRRPGFCRHQLVEVGYLKSAHGHAQESVAFNLQPRPNGQLLLGSSRQYGALGRHVESRIVGRMLERARAFVPGLDDLPLLRAWTGFRAATSDHLPLIGPLPGHERLLVASGHEGLGITTSLATAHLIADHLLGRCSPISSRPYTLERFLPEAA